MKNDKTKNPENEGCATLDANGKLTGITEEELCDRAYRALYAALADQYGVEVIYKGVRAVGDNSSGSK